MLGLLAIFQTKKVGTTALSVHFKPFCGFSVAIVGVAQAQIVIPPRPHYYFPTARVLLFIEVSAESISVNVFENSLIRYKSINDCTSM